METQNINVTQWQANSIDFIIAVISPTEKLMFVDYDGNVIKRSDSYGGVNEIVIVENIKATVIINSDDVSKLDVGGTTYTLYKITSTGELVKLFSGTVSVVEADPPEGVEVDNIRISMDTPYEFSGSGPSLDCLVSNNFFCDVLEEDLIVLFQNFRDGAVKTVKISNPNNVTTGLTFSYEDATIKWLTADNNQPAHPEGKTILYSFQRWGAQILATASDPF